MTLLYFHYAGGTTLKNIELSFESLNLKCQSPIQPPINVQSLKMSILSRFSRFLDFAVGRVGDSVGD